MQKLKQKAGIGEGPSFDVVKPPKRKNSQITAPGKNGPLHESGETKTQRNKLTKKNSVNVGESKAAKGPGKVKTIVSDAATAKPNWSEMKKEKKQLRLNRKKSKVSEDVFNKTSKAKMLAAQIQRKVTRPEVRHQACIELHALLIGKYKTLALTHDLSRVIQVLLKYSPYDIKTEVTEELLDIMVQMAQSKYAQHTVRRTLKYGTDHIRHEVIKRFYGNIVSLATHAVSAPLLDFAYTEFATKKEKLLMQQEFYGDIYKNAKDENLTCLADSYKYSPGLKNAILNSCKAVIQKIMDKNLHDKELIHVLIYEYLCECGAEERKELVSQLAGSAARLARSLPGANAACVCFWHGTNKDKKTMIKAIKDHVVALSKHKTGYRLLLAMFDSADDTVLLRRALIAPLLADIRDVVTNHWGSMVVHWLVKPKDKATFHPILIKFLEEGARRGGAKKEPRLRQAELRDAVLPAIIEDATANADFWLSSKNLMLLLITVMSISSSKELVSAVGRVICSPEWRVGSGEGAAPAVEEAGIHLCLKRMAALDSGAPHPLAEAVCAHIQPDTIELWFSSNRGCFFMLKLIQNNNNEHGEELRRVVRPYAALLEEQPADGAKLLLAELARPPPPRAPAPTPAPAPA